VASLEWAEARAAEVIALPLDRDHTSARSWLATARGRSLAAGPLPQLTRHRPPVIGERIAESFGLAFDVVVTMRTYLAGVTIPFLEAGVPGVLDADDDDARTSEALARLDPSEADEVAALAEFQRAAFPMFERVFFASALDAVPPFEHLPNAVRIPARWTMRAPADPLDLVFVGLPGYLPNRDAIERLDRIVSAIAAMGVDVQLHRPGPDDDVGPYYGRAHIAVVPIRAGGGTRIKILEAFAHGCPVVATPSGARGLDVEDDRHLVITADDDDDVAFAEAVVALARDDGRRARLAATAREFVQRHHDVETVGEQLATVVSRVASNAAHKEDEA
jgi:glycosyltransferase involved in cell wall biosynthesis